MLFHAYSTGILLCITNTLKGVSSLPLDSNPTTSASELQNSTTILGARDTSPNPSDHPTLAVAYYDKCDGLPLALSGSDADVYNYVVNTCHQVDSNGGATAMIIGWTAAGFNKITLYTDAYCTDRIGDQQAQAGWGIACIPLPKSPKALSFKGTVVS
ncbi:hypothetical protein G7Y79_00004g015520 [Physcia stellaris]|nr:hypothetical protein G7Y79_00004g015520 [Physcia stellaris]